MNGPEFAARLSILADNLELADSWLVSPALTGRKRLELARLELDECRKQINGMRAEVLSYGLEVQA